MDSSAKHQHFCKHTNHEEQFRSPSLQFLSCFALYNGNIQIWNKKSEQMASTALEQSPNMTLWDCDKLTNRMHDTQFLQPLETSYESTFQQTVSEWCLLLCQSEVLLCCLYSWYMHWSVPALQRHSKDLGRGITVQRERKWQYTGITWCCLQCPYSIPRRIQKRSCCKESDIWRSWNKRVILEPAKKLFEKWCWTTASCHSPVVPECERSCQIMLQAI